MMSLSTISLSKNITQLYRYKLYAYRNSVISLMIIQIVALLLSLNGTNQSMTVYENVSITIHSYSANIVLAFSMIWAFITAISLTTKPYRDADFILVASRLTSHLSNILFLLTASMIAGVTAMLSGFLLKLIAVYLLSQEVIAQQTLPISHLLLGILVATLYMVLISSAGFLAGMLTQWHRSFIIIIPALVMALFFIEWTTVDETEQTSMPAMIALFRFFGTEHSLLMFTVKVLLCVLICYGITHYLSSRMEVKG